jgi:hypothetical protein
MQLYLDFYFKKLYMFWTLIMPIIRSNITALVAIGVTNECGIVKCIVRLACPGWLVVAAQQLSCKLQLSCCDVMTNHPGQTNRTIHFMIPHSFVIPTTANAVMLLLIMGMMNAQNM